MSADEAVAPSTKTAASMKSAATASSVKTSAATAVPSSSMLGQRRLRQPRQRNKRHNANYNSN